MKEYFLVNKDVKLRNKQNEWLTLTGQHLLGAAELSQNDDNRLETFATQAEAEAWALDGVNQQTEQRFFPIFKVEVSEKHKGIKKAVTMQNGTVIPVTRFFGRHMTITEIILSHIDTRFDNIPVERVEKVSEVESDVSSEEEEEDLGIEGLFTQNQKEEGELSSEEEEQAEFSAEDEEQEEEQELSSDEEQEEEQALSATEKVEQVAKKSALDRIRPYVPSVKTVVKNGIPLLAAGLTLYVGNDFLLAQAAEYSIPLQQGLTASAQYLPEVVATSSALLPVAAGIGTRVAVEVPEASASLFSKAWSGLKYVASKATDTFTGFKERWKERRAKAAVTKAELSQSSNGSATEAKKRLSGSGESEIQFKQPESRVKKTRTSVQQVQFTVPPKPEDLLERLDTLTSTPSTQPSVGTGFGAVPTLTPLHDQSLSATGTGAERQAPVLVTKTEKRKTVLH